VDERIIMKNTIKCKKIGIYHQHLQQFLRIKERRWGPTGHLEDLVINTMLDNEIYLPRKV
jgi:hypothetical protein